MAGWIYAAHRKQSYRFGPKLAERSSPSTLRISLGNLNAPYAVQSEGVSEVTYYLSAMLPVSFSDALERTEEALKQEGFGVISRIDIQEALKTKIGVDFRPYMILGACNPALAYEALKIEDKVGTMLPCNVIVQGLGPKQTEVAAIDPVASMQAIENPKLPQLAQEVRTRLRRVIQSLAAH